MQNSNVGSPRLLAYPRALGSFAAFQLVTTDRQANSISPRFELINVKCRTLVGLDTRSVDVIAN
jgi:hypothetical protein